MAVLAILRMLIPALYKNIMDLYNNLPNYITSFQDYINNFEIIKKSSLFANGIDLYSEMNNDTLRQYVVCLSSASTHKVYTI